MEYFLQIGVNTLVLASLYAIIALGYNLLYGMNRFFDMTYAGYMVLGAYGYFAINKIGLGIFPTLLLTFISVAALSYLCERFLYTVLRQRQSTAVVMMVTSLGVLTIIQGIIAMVFTSNIQVLGSTSKVFRLGDVVFTDIHIVTITSALLMYIVTWYVLSRTKFGVQLRAVSENEELARASGIQVPQIRLIVTVTASIIGAIAGILYGMDTSIEPLMGLGLLLKGIIAAIIAGLGSISFGIAGAILLATSENAAVWFISGEWKDAVAFLILIIVLLVRPQGILQK
jgi:branched-subunit amino acid ABC-type transport system permease component